MKLAGKKALITGGNSGIGLATARLFISEGAEVAITGRDQQTLDEAVADLGPKAHGYRADVTVAADRKRLFAELVKTLADLTSSSRMQAFLAGHRLARPTKPSSRRSSTPTSTVLSLSSIRRSSHERQRQHHFPRIGAQLSRSTRLGCLRCHERRPRLDGAIHRRGLCTAQDPRERGGPGIDKDSDLEARGTRQRHGSGIRKTFGLLFFHGPTCPLGRAGRSGQGCAISCLERFVVHQCGRAYGGWRTDGRSLRGPILRG